MPISVVDPDVVVQLDETAMLPGGPREIRGAQNRAKGAVTFTSLARFVQPALVNGSVGLVWAQRGRLMRVRTFTLKDGRIALAEISADPARFRDLELAVQSV